MIACGCRRKALKTKKIIIEVALEVEEDVDSEDLFCCCDYEFKDYEDRIIETELRDYTEVYTNDQTLKAVKKFL